MKDDFRVIGDGPLAQAVRRQGGVEPSGAGLIVLDEGDDARTLDSLLELISAETGTSASCKAFSSEVDTGSREENASKQKPRAPIRSNRIGNGSSQIIAQIADPALLRSVEARLHVEPLRPRPILVNAGSLVAEHLVAHAGLFKLALWRNQPRLNVAMIGFGALGRAFFDELILDGVADGLAAPSILILTPDVEGAKAGLRRDAPEIDQSAHISFFPLDLATLGDAESNPLANTQSAGSLTAILTLLDDPKETLVASAALCDLQDRGGLAQAALFVGGPGAHAALSLATPLRPANNLGRRIEAIGDLSSITNLPHYILVERDRLARRIHEAYQAEYAGQTEGGSGWEDLAETYRRANRRAARHLTQKLHAIGVCAPEAAVSKGWIDPQTYDSLIAPLAKAAVEDRTIRRLARLEHERWCADRRLDGWRFGPARDDLRRRHPDLVPFDSPRLTAEEIAKDIAQIRFMLGAALEIKENGATTRFTIGIMDPIKSDQAGVEIQALCARLEEEPWREIVVICPLLTSRELDLVVDLTARLVARKRHFLVIVPEYFAENRTLRDETVARSARLRELLALPQTLIVPTGPEGLLADDLWEDASETPEGLGALSDYVVARADALLETRMSPSAPLAEGAAG